MHELVKTEFLQIAVNPIKQRMYWTMQAFWRGETEKATDLQAIFQQLAGQMPRQGTVVLDTTGLRLMEPHLADFFITRFTTFLLDNQIKALAYVGDPKNVILKMQFRRVLRSIESANEVQSQIFIERQEAENWLDMYDPDAIEQSTINNRSQVA